MLFRSRATSYFLSGRLVEDVGASNSAEESPTEDEGATHVGNEEVSNGVKASPASTIEDDGLIEGQLESSPPTSQSATEVAKSVKKEKPEEILGLKSVAFPPNLSFVLILR